MTEFPILQFGASRFLQAHVDLFVSEALPRGEAMGHVAVAGTTGSPESRRRIAAFAAGKPYTFSSRASVMGRSSMKAWRSRASGRAWTPATRWDELERLFIAARCAVSNTADRGYETRSCRPARRRAAEIVPGQAWRAAACAASRRRRTDHAFPCQLTPANGQSCAAGCSTCWTGAGAGGTRAARSAEECASGSFARRPVVSEPLQPFGAVASLMRSR